MLILSTLEVLPPTHHLLLFTALFMQGYKKPDAYIAAQGNFL